MAILRVNPNRMELIRLRRRLALAKRGHKLLQDKLEEMMRRFLLLLKDIGRAKDDLAARTVRMIGDLLYVRITASKENFEEAVNKVDSKISLGVSTVRIMNVKVPVFDIKDMRVEKRYDLFKTSGQLDVAINNLKIYIRSLLTLAQSLKTADILSYEIERTRRRVNALEYILIPSIYETIKYIEQKLNELERSNLTRLMRVKRLIEAR